jgi:hypothetical protein
MVSKKLASKKPGRRALLYVVASFAAIGLIVGTTEAINLTHIFHKRPTQSQANGPTPEQQKQQSQTYAQQKQQTIENPPQTTTPTPETVSTTAISLTTQPGTKGSLTVFTNLGAIGNGTCTLTIANGSTTKTYTAQVVYQPQYSICAGYSIPVSDLGAGTWHLHLAVTSNGGTASKDTTAEVK